MNSLVTTPLERICYMCKNTKPTTEFYKDKTQTGGYGYTCKPCSIEKQRKYRESKPAQYWTEYDRKYAETKRINAKQKRQNNKELYRHKWRVKFESDKDKINNWARIRYANNIEVEREKARQYFANNPEVRRKARRNWVAKNREVVRAFAAEYRARKLAATTEKVDYKQIIERDKSICWICKQIVPEDKIDIDHIIPLTRGGSHSYENLAVSCTSCNRKKNNKDPNLFGTPPILTRPE